MKKRLERLAVVLMLGTVLVSGCGNANSDELMKEKKENLVTMYRTMESEYNNLSSEYDKLQAKVDDMYKNEELNPGITSLGDGSGDLTLNSVSNRVEFNSPLEYPESTTVSTSSAIDIVTGVTVVARDNWITRLSNSTLELQHSSGISGSINISNVSEYMQDGTVKDDVLTPWVSQIATENVEYTNIFVDDDIWGAQAKAPILVDGQNGRMVCGVVPYGSYVATYIFVYDGDIDGTKEELIKNVLNSVNMFGENIVVE